MNGALTEGTRRVASDSMLDREGVNRPSRRTTSRWAAALFGALCLALSLTGCGAATAEQVELRQAPMAQPPAGIRAIGDISRAEAYDFAFSIFSESHSSLAQPTGHPAQRIRSLWEACSDSVECIAGRELAFRAAWNQTELPGVEPLTELELIELVERHVTRIRPLLTEGLRAAADCTLARVADTTVSPDVCIRAELWMAYLALRKTDAWAEQIVGRSRAMCGELQSCGRECRPFLHELFRRDMGGEGVQISESALHDCALAQSLPGGYRWEDTESMGDELLRRWLLDHKHLADPATKEGIECIVKLPWPVKSVDVAACPAVETPPDLSSDERRAVQMRWRPARAWASWKAKPSDKDFIKQVLDEKTHDEQALLAEFAEFCAADPDCADGCQLGLLAMSRHLQRLPDYGRPPLTLCGPLGGDPRRWPDVTGYLRARLLDWHEALESRLDWGEAATLTCAMQRTRVLPKNEAACVLASRASMVKLRHWICSVDDPARTLARECAWNLECSGQCGSAYLSMSTGDSEEELNPSSCAELVGKTPFRPDELQAAMTNRALDYVANLQSTGPESLARRAHALRCRLKTLRVGSYRGPCAPDDTCAGQQRRKARLLFSP